MSHAHIGTTMTFLFASVVGTSNQQAAPDQRRAHAAADSITIRGCVAESMGRYMLNQALVITPTPTPVPSAASDPAPAKSSDDQVYELIGDRVKPHVGHQVEIVGTMPSKAATGNAQEAQDPKQTAHPMTGTVNVKTVTMLASTCR